jgi:hypothetical protein
MRNLPLPFAMRASFLESVKGGQRDPLVDSLSALLAPALPSTLVFPLSALLATHVLATAMTLSHMSSEKMTA